MISVRAGSIRLTFNFGFFLAVSLFCLIDEKGIMVCTFCSCIVHEIGHIVAAILNDVNIEKISFGFGGIKMISEGKIKGLGSEIFILLLGPFFNVLSALMYYYLECYTAFLVNLILAVFNLLPFSSLDGGTVIKKIFEYFQLNAALFMKIISIISAIIICGFLYCFSLGNILIYAAIIILTVYEFAID